MAGRKAAPYLIGGEKPHRSNAEIKKRVENMPSGCDAEFVPPEELSPEASKEWKRVVRLYRQLDAELLNDLDSVLLTAYCESVAIYKRAQAEYQKSGLVGREKRSGKVAENPYLRIMTREGQNIARYSEQLCLSPVGRAKMGLAKTKADKQGGIAGYREKWKGK